MGLKQKNIEERILNKAEEIIDYIGSICGEDATHSIAEVKVTKKGISENEAKLRVKEI